MDNTSDVSNDTEFEEFSGLHLNPLDVPKERYELISTTQYHDHDFVVFISSLVVF